MRKLVQRALRHAGYRVERWRPASRFNAMDETLELLRHRGFAPRVIVDGGANRGQWAQLALAAFPDARLHLIEPQPRCRPALEQLVAGCPLATLHAVALSEPGRHRLSFAGGAECGGTGVHVTTPAETEVELECGATTLDDLFASRVTRADRLLLKLDLEGHELAALRGATTLLDSVEVAIVEAQLYDINLSGVTPVFRDVYDFLAHRGFDLYDIASTGWRHRDLRMHMLDPVFVRTDSPLYADRSWL
jgi:FkbM family methyltransferase